MKIIITILDPETLKDYQNVHPEIIKDDFLDDPKNWLKGSEIEILI